MAYCVLNYHQKASNGAYLASHPMSVANDPTAALQAEMRLLSTKELPHSHPHPLTHHSHHQHMIHHHHHHPHSQHLQHLGHVHGSHHVHQHLHSAPVANAHLSPRHASSSSSIASNSSSASSVASGEMNASPLPRNRRRSQQPPSSATQAANHNDSQQFQTHSNPHHYSNQSQSRRSYQGAQSNSASMSRNRNAQDSRRGSTGSSVRHTSPSSCGSNSLANTRSPSPQVGTTSGDYQRVPLPLSAVVADTVEVVDPVVSSDSSLLVTPIATITTSAAASSSSSNTQTTIAAAPSTAVATTSTTTNPHSNSDAAQQVLSFEQVHRLHQVMEQVVPIHGRGNFPTLDIKLKTLVKVVRNKLESADPPVKVCDIRLNGGAASYVLSPETGGYNDLDLIFAVDLTDSSAYDRVRTAVLDSLLEFLPEGVNRTRLTSTSLKEAYIHKMVKVAEQDRWSLISLSNNRGRNVELKFVDTMKRQFEFSVDSFHIILDSLLMFYECSQLPISTNIYPTVIGESVYGDFHEALDHLEHKLIATRNPEQIRGGGLLKYCNLLIRDYRPAEPEQMKTLERYMCSRFFIDFNEITQQRTKLESYLANHFIGDDLMRIRYLMQLYKVVDKSTVCLMGYERRQTLCLIEELAYAVYYETQHSSSPAASSLLISSPTSRPLFGANYKMPYNAMTMANDARSVTPSVDTQSNGDSSDQESNESSSGELCSTGNCTCNAHNSAVANHMPQYQTFVLSGAPGHYYYPAAFQPGYGCFNSCHCGGGWMTCA
jgi:hypothetical protein